MALFFYWFTFAINLRHRKFVTADVTGDLGVTYALHLWLVGKRMVDFIFVVIELFSLSLAGETL